MQHFADPYRTSRVYFSANQRPIGGESAAYAFSHRSRFAQIQSMRREVLVDAGHQESVLRDYSSAQSSNVFTSTRPRNRAMCSLLLVRAIEECVHFSSSAQSSNVFTFARLRNRAMCSLLLVRAIEQCVHFYPSAQSSSVPDTRLVLSSARERPASAGRSLIGLRVVDDWARQRSCATEMFCAEAGLTRCGFVKIR